MHFTKNFLECLGSFTTYRGRKSLSRLALFEYTLDNKKVTKKHNNYIQFLYNILTLIIFNLVKGIGEESKTRTHINAFGERHSTFELFPHVSACTFIGNEKYN